MEIGHHVFFGAGEGDRTLVVSLGSFCSTIELHPLGVKCGVDSNTDERSDNGQRQRRATPTPPSPQRFGVYRVDGL